MLASDVACFPFPDDDDDDPPPAALPVVVGANRSPVIIRVRPSTCYCTCLDPPSVKSSSLVTYILRPFRQRPFRKGLITSSPLTAARPKFRHGLSLSVTFITSFASANPAPSIIAKPTVTVAAAPK